MKQLAIKHPDKHVRRVGNKRKDVRAPTVSEPSLGFLLSLPALRSPPASRLCQNCRFNSEEEGQSAYFTS